MGEGFLLSRDGGSFYDFCASFSKRGHVYIIRVRIFEGTVNFRLGYFVISCSTETSLVYSVASVVLGPCSESRN